MTQFMQKKQAGTDLHSVARQLSWPEPGAMRTVVLQALRALSRALDAVVAHVEQAPPRHAAYALCTTQTTEFGTIEVDGRVLGAYYLDGELVAVVPDVARL